jgi:hypothetical protein
MEFRIMCRTKTNNRLWHQDLTGCPCPAHIAFPKPQLRLRDALPSELTKQAAAALASLAFGCPRAWALGRTAAIVLVSCAVRAAIELKTRRLFLQHGACTSAPAPGQAGREVAGCSRRARCCD